MPKSKNKTQPITAATVAAAVPMPAIGPEARQLLLCRIDQQLADLQKVADDLMAVRNSLTQSHQAEMQATVQKILDQDGPGPGPVPTKKRGRPAGSKNKPKQDKQPDQPAPAEQPAGQDQDLFQSAVAATWPERDQEFAQAG